MLETAHDRLPGLRPRRGIRVNLAGRPDVIGQRIAARCCRASRAWRATSGRCVAALVALGAIAYVVASFALWRACLRPPGAESAIFGVLPQMRVQRS